ncbi:hypothetical protein Q6A68_07580, partial [Helicobacter pylori]|nr:hypothetical protein [Helicobacter pylori]
SLPWFATISQESMFVSLCHACGIKSAEVQGLKLAQNSVVKNATKTDRMRGVESGMTEYITKPYSGEYLATVVKRSIKLEGGES